MKTFNKVVEEEEARFIGTWLPNGKESEQPQMEADFDQAMHKAALAVLEELDWKKHQANKSGFQYSEDTVAWYEEKIATLRDQLTDKD